MEIFSDGTRRLKICHTNIIPVQRLKVEIFLDGYVDPKFIPYEIFSHENYVNEKKDNYGTSSYLGLEVLIVGSIQT